MKKILLISGSLRTESVNTKLLKAFADELPEEALVDWADINLPLFNEDLESDFPAAVTQFKDRLAQADVIIISTPEYNRAMSGALKNAIDWASRPYGDNSWSGKTVLVVSASPGGIAGALALYQVKQSLLHLGAIVPGQPEFAVGGAFDKFNEAGELIDETTREHIVDAVKQILN